MARAATADPDAQRALVLRVLPTIRRAVARLLNSVADREDVAQLALMEVLRCAGSWRAEGDIEAWARRVAIWRALKYMRSEERRVRHLAAHATANGPPPAVSEMPVHSVQVYLDHIPEQQRVAVVLRHGFGYSIAEIADLTDAPANTVKARLVSGRRRLRELVERDRSSPQPFADANTRTGTR